MYSFPLLIALSFIALTLFLSLKRQRNLPPGPFPFPIVGNIFQLGPKPHQIFAKLSKKYGPLMSIHLGSLYTVVVSSPEMAKEILYKHGQVFSGRVILQADHACDHYKISLGFQPLGDLWRNMRKICIEQMFSNTSMEANKGLRQQKLQQLLDFVQKCSDTGRAVDVPEASFITTLNLMSATLFSTQATEFDSMATMEFKELLEGVADLITGPNFADYFPILKPFDPQGVKRRADDYFRKLLTKIEGYLSERMESRRKNPDAPKKNDLLETLVDMVEANEYKLTTDHITHLMLDLLVAALAITTTMESIMSELVINPDKMAKLKAELKSVAGEKKLLEESDMARLPYLAAVIKEAMRIHPPAPLLFPRKAESDQMVNGYFIPKGTQVLINVWAMGRDPSIWKNPDLFEPERFLDQTIDFKGQNFELIPFGAGRRVCPGMPLADRVLHTMTATLVHNFEWKLEEEVPLRIIPFRA